MVRADVRMPGKLLSVSDSSASCCSWITAAAHAARALQPAVRPSSSPDLCLALLPDPAHLTLLRLAGDLPASRSLHTHVVHAAC